MQYWIMAVHRLPLNEDETTKNNVFIIFEALKYYYNKYVT